MADVAPPTKGSTRGISGGQGIAIGAVAGAAVSLLGAVGFKQLAANEPQIALALFAFVAAFVIGILGFLQAAKSRLGMALLLVTALGFFAVGVVFALPYRGQVTVHLMASPQNLAGEHVPPAYVTFSSHPPGANVDWTGGLSGGVKDSEQIAIDVSSLVQHYTDTIQATRSGSAAALTNCQSTSMVAGGGGI
jgi:hypothetical protein